MAFNLKSLDGLTVLGTDAGVGAIVGSSDTTQNDYSITGLTSTFADWFGATSVTLQNVVLNPGENGTLGTVDVYINDGVDPATLIGTESIIGFTGNSILLGDTFSGGSWTNLYVISTDSLEGAVSTGFSTPLAFQPDANAAGYTPPPAIFDLSSLDGLVVSANNVGSNVNIDYANSDTIGNNYSVGGVTNLQGTDNPGKTYSFENASATDAENGTLGTVELFSQNPGGPSTALGTFSILGFSSNGILLGAGFGDGVWQSTYLISDSSLNATFANEMFFQQDPTLQGFVPPTPIAPPPTPFDLTTLNGLTVSADDAGFNGFSSTAIDKPDTGIYELGFVRSLFSSTGAVTVSLENVSATHSAAGGVGTADVFTTDGSGNTTLYASASILGFTNTDILLAAGADGAGNWSNYILISNSSLDNFVQGNNNVGSFLTFQPNAAWVGFTLPASVPCFAAGTRILTPRGEVAVETLAEGDAVVTASGAIRRIVWAGQRLVDCRRHAQKEKVLPVRIAAGAFAEAVPARDLFLSPDHAVFISGAAEDGSDDVLIPVQELVNGVSIVQVSVDSVRYHHIELERHDVVLAEGLTVESYLDTGNRAAFGNGGAAMQLQPDFSALMWEAAGCAPLVVTGPVRDAVRLRLQQRAAALGLAEMAAVAA